MVRAILAVLIVVVVVAIAAVATNFVNIRTSGELRAPSVSVQGGEMPTVAVDTKKVVLETRGLPVPRDFKPEPHSSRKGWVARFSSYPDNPFTADIDEPLWRTRGGQVLSLRERVRAVAQFLARYGADLPGLCAGHHLCLLRARA